MTRLIHYNNLGTARFITFSCFGRKNLLIHDEDIKMVLEELNNAKVKHEFLVYGFVMMPSHVHIVIYPRHEIDMGKVIGEIKSLSAKRILARWRKDQPHLLKLVTTALRGQDRFVLWLPKCYDHNCRTIETTIEKINYCHMNPVKAGLVHDPFDWKWSSYGSYHGVVDQIIAIDRIEI